MERLELGLSQSRERSPPAAHISAGFYCSLPRLSSRRVAPGHEVPPRGAPWTCALEVRHSLALMLSGDVSWADSTLAPAASSIPASSALLVLSSSPSRLSRFHPHEHPHFFPFLSQLCSESARAKKGRAYSLHTHTHTHPHTHTHTHTHTHKTHTHCARRFASLLSHILIHSQVQPWPWAKPHTYLQGSFHFESRGLASKHTDSHARTHTHTQNAHIGANSLFAFTLWGVHPRPFSKCPT